MNRKSNKRTLQHRTKAFLWAALALCCLAPWAAGAGAQGKEDPELQRVFRQMETAGKGFRSFAAKISKKRYTSILKEFGTAETGEFYFARAKDGSSMIRQEITKPGITILTIKDGVAYVYRPKLKEAQVFNLGKHKDKAEFLAVGIGQPPSELQKNFTISYVGTETISGSSCSMLSLKPKDAKTAAYYSSIVLWVKQSSGIPAQYKLQEPNSDYELVTFSEEKLNLKIPDSRFVQKFPDGVQPQRLQ